MTLGAINELNCELCKEKITGGWELQELAPEVWVIVCDPCSETLELDAGK
jgi:hypothetical protein